MSSLPSGTVTFLFTDIEGSTKLWQQHPETMKVALARHDALLRAIIESRDGYVFKTVGDEFCAVFDAAPDALAAALAIQRALHTQDWGPTPIKVRMALHTGGAELRDGDYFGATLSRVARLMAAGHGGQVLLSHPAYDLVRDDLPQGASLRDMGERRLRDLVRPEHIFQLVASDLPADFPALKTLDAFPNNLPVQLTSFVGREKEMAEVKRLLGKTHLLTLTGVGGTGKTRLSLQVAADLLDTYPDGVWLVELAPLTDPGLVPQAIAGALEVREEPGRPLPATLTDFLRPKRLLLMLDNCEHLVEACARLAETLLRACPHLKILASSREALGVAGETPFHVSSLSHPDPRQPVSPASLSQYESVRLFIDRATTVQPAFAVTNQNAPAVAQVCHRLDGIPLAIELAAARVKVMRVEQIASRLDDRFRLLTGGSRTALPRQQTLAALIDWSYNLLTEPERVLLRRLAVFAGGWALEAAEVVCAEVGQNDILSYEVLDLLTHLVDKSLVLVEELPHETRYRLLETIRQYGRDKLLESGEGDQVRDRHLGYFLKLAEEEERQLDGPDQRAWGQRFHIEQDNFRAALQWASASANPVGLQLAGANGVAWRILGYLSEGRGWLEELLAQPWAMGRTGARAKALFSLGFIIRTSGDFATTRSSLEESVAIWRELGSGGKRGLAQALDLLAMAERTPSNYAQARSLYEEILALFRQVGDKNGLASALRHLANILISQGDFAEARKLLEESLALLREIGNIRGIGTTMSGLGDLARSQGDYTMASALHEKTLALLKEAGVKLGVVNQLSVLGEIALYQGHYGLASARLEESLVLSQELGYILTTARSLLTLGRVALVQGDYQRAATHMEASLLLLQQLGETYGLMVCIVGLAAVAREQRQPARAVQLCGTVEALREAAKIYIIPYDRAEFDHLVAALRTQLEETVFAAAWAEGHAMTLEQAIALALEELSHV